VTSVGENYIYIHCGNSPTLHGITLELIELDQVTVNVLKTEDMIICLLVRAIRHLGGWRWMSMVISRRKLKKLGGNPAPMCHCMHHESHVHETTQ
jgi:hypothetical protein